MTPLLYFSNCCCGHLPQINPKTGDCDEGNPILLGATLLDVVVTLTTLVVGLLALYTGYEAHLHVGLGAVTVSTTIILSWVGMMIKIVYNYRNKEVDALNLGIFEALTKSN